ncbi:MAG TPA: hypothetical protein VN909_04575, partial [Candidatus Dormibacteraeota bacterium]|nr:hypothetical protein [Candidatus Dormibacteraeota bacterium]
MRDSIRRVLIAAAAAAMLSGCGFGSSPAGAFAAAGAPGVASQASASRAGSWMLPEARGESLVYVSDTWDIGLVYVFSYPGGKHVGTLTGFYNPTGECVDKHGDVWVLNMSPEVIVEYAHGGTSPIATLDDPVGGFSCSIDATTGNLAIDSVDPAKVAVYANAAGTPTVYTYSGAASLASCAYDGSGNLFIDSSNASRPFAELPKGGNSFVEIKYPNDAPLGNMQWDGRYLAVQERTHGNQGPITIDRVQVA